jgi:uncharacterized protein DUF1207
MNSGPALVVLAAAVLAACGCAAPRQEGAPPGGPVPPRRGPGARLLEPPPEEEKVEPAPGDLRRTFFPRDGFLYDPYLAAPRQSQTGSKFLIPLKAGETVRVENALGLVLPVVRWSPEEDPAAGTEIQVEAAVFARFDIHERWDLDAADFRFGVPLVYRDGDLAWKFHLYHLTSHLGDEFIERTGTEVTPYHLEEASAGVSWDFAEGARVYGEGGVAVYTSRPTGNGRVQLGAEWVGRKGGAGLSPYVALDLQARNEQDWIPNKVLAAGIAYGRNVRFGLELYHGRDPQTQFLDDNVFFLSVGFAVAF